jgi:uncharacterized protein YabE (DUF348 family)
MPEEFEKLKLRVNRFRQIRLPRRIRRLKIMSRHPFAVPVITFAVLLTLTAAGAVLLKQHYTPKNDAYVVIVSHDHTEQTVPSRAPTVGTLLKRLNIKLNEGDVVEPGLDAHINQDKFRVNIYRALPVEIIDGGQKQMIFSAARTPRSVVSQAGVSLYNEDLVTATPASNFVDSRALGTTLNIKRSVPIRLILYGTPTVVRSHSNTIGEMLAEKRIKLRGGDRVEPAANTPITPDQQIFILREGTKIVTETQVIPPSVQSIDDPKLSAGSSAIRQQGSPGTLLLTFQLDEKTGARTPLQSVVVQPPVPQVVARGTAPVSGNLASWLYKLRMCESHGNYQINTGNGYYGAYQFSLSTWQRIGYSGYPNEAPPAVQDAAIVKNTNLSGGGLASQNPGCYRSTGISAFPPNN